MDHIVHGVAKSRTRLSDFHFHFQRPGGDVSTKGQRITILGSAGYHVHPNTILPTAHGPYVTTGWGHVPF